MLNVPFFTIATAKNLNMVVEKRDVHPKMESALLGLEKEYEKNVVAAKAFAQSRNIRIESQNRVTVYLISEPGTTVDEMSLQTYGAEIIKRTDNVSKIKAPINRLTTIADNVDAIAQIKIYQSQDSGKNPIIFLWAGAVRHNIFLVGFSSLCHRMCAGMVVGKRFDKIFRVEV